MPGLRGVPFFGVDFYCIFGRFGKMTHLVNFKKCRGSSPCCPGWCGAHVGAQYPFHHFIDYFHFMHHSFAFLGSISHPIAPNALHIVWNPLKFGLRLCSQKIKCNLQMNNFTKWNSRKKNQLSIQQFPILDYWPPPNIYWT